MTQTTTSPALSDAAREFVAKQHKLLVGDAWRDSLDGRELRVYDPSTGKEITKVVAAGSADVDRAVKEARTALRGSWGTMTAARRSLLMNRLADLMEEHGDELAELEAIDNGKPVTYAKVVDVAESVNWLRYYAGWPTKIGGETSLAGENDSLYYSQKLPVGVCGLIVPWNYPLLMAIWKVAPALAAGCTLVLKPAEQTPLTALRLGELALEAGIPAGVLNVLTGDGATGAALVDHPGVDKISFTGSTGVGREIGAKAGHSLKRVTLELGGKSANIILPDADLEQAVAGSFSGIYFNTGQSCTAGSRLYVHTSQFDEVVAAIAELARKTTPLPGLDPASTLGPIVSGEQFDRVNDYISLGVEEGAELVAGGVTEDHGEGWFIAPTLFTNTDDRRRIAREEIFGPVLVASPYDDLDEVVQRANDSEYGLAAGLWTRDVNQAHRVASQLEAGIVYVNRWTQFGPGVPQGGMKGSGLGREHGRLGLDAYLEHKSVLINLAQ